MSDPLFAIDGRAILVAGGAGGLGAPLAAALAQRGAKVLIADIDMPRAEKIARELGAAHNADVRACALDVVSAQSCAAAVDLAVSAWGRLDGLINATGIYRVADALQFDDADWESTIATNLTGAFRLARAAGRVMVAQKSGRIVTLASVSSVVSNARYAAYAASKAGVAHLTRVLGGRMGPRRRHRQCDRPGRHSDTAGAAHSGRQQAARSGAEAHSDGPLRHT